MANGYITAGIGALGDIIGGLAGNALSAYEMKQLAKYQAKLNYKYAVKSAQEMPGYTRQGLVNADYNPMLAVGSGIGSSQSGWSSLASPTGADLSDTGSHAISNAMAVQQQKNNNALAESQVENYNADTVLKNNQAMTEMFTQLEKLNRSDLYKAEKILTDKKSDWFEKEQAREDLRVANEIERTKNDYKIGMLNVGVNQLRATAENRNSISNAQDVQNRYDIAKNTRSFGIAGVHNSGYSPKKRIPLRQFIKNGFKR